MPPLLDIEDLEVRFPVGGGWLRAPQAYVHAVSGVSLSVGDGEIVAVVGESGCGKTTLARTILGLATATGGSIRFDGHEVGGAAGKSRSGKDRREIQMVFQDPFDSLNPRKTIYQTLAQPLRIHRVVPRRELRAEVVRLLDMVGLSPGQAYLGRYPHQFSGGQRQRICIARALALRPRIVIADEAVSALDISIRAQILTLLKDLKDRHNLAYLFITHDLGVVRSFSDRVIVMYLGQVVEEGPTEAIFARPSHPYTLALLEASPIPDPERARQRRSPPLAGDIPSPISPPDGCRFHTRCPVARDICRTVPPPVVDAGGGQRSRCHFAAEAGTWDAPAPAEAIA
ncbi:MAG: ABC transporter ATP-binding protein [Hyphomicrobiaceae bacterium]